MIIVDVIKKSDDNLRNVDEALKKFKNKIKKAGLMLELYERMSYEKPSVKKRRLKNKKR